MVDAPQGGGGGVGGSLSGVVYEVSTKRDQENGDKAGIVTWHEWLTPDEELGQRKQSERDDSEKNFYTDQDIPRDSFNNVFYLFWSWRLRHKKIASK